MSVRDVSDIQPLVFVYLIQHGRSCCVYYLSDEYNVTHWQRARGREGGGVIVKKFIARRGF